MNYSLILLNIYLIQYKITGDRNDVITILNCILLVDNRWWPPLHTNSYNINKINSFFTVFEEFRKILDFHQCIYHVSVNEFFSDSIKHKIQYKISGDCNGHVITILICILLVDSRWWPPLHINSYNINKISSSVIYCVKENTVYRCCACCRWPGEKSVRRLPRDAKAEEMSLSTRAIASRLWRLLGNITCRIWLAYPP